MSPLGALVRKETLQILRDPSALLIAFALPVILLFIFGYGVNLDQSRLRIGLAIEDRTPEAPSLAAALTGSREFDVRIGQDPREFEEDLVAGRVRGIVVIPADFSAAAARADDPARLQVLADGSEPNIASFVQNNAEGVVQVWLALRALEGGETPAAGPISAEPRMRYNPELRSRNFLLPGSIAIVMTLIGTLLTALVIAREWERGTMESLMATPVSVRTILLGKLIPYFALGLGSMAVCWLAATLWYGVPFRGSFLALAAATSVFLVCALGQGLLISSALRDQFAASQAAIVSAFLPSFMLSGFIFEIASMPEPIRLLSYAVAARYFVTVLQTLFLVGDVLPLLLASVGAMAMIGAVFLLLSARLNRKSLDR